MKKVWITAICAVVMVTQGLNAQDTAVVRLDLKKAVDLGLANNLNVQIGSIDVERSKIDWNQARLNMLPNVNASVNSGINQGRSIDPFTNSYINQRNNFSSYGISGGIILFNGFSMQHNNKSTALSYEAEKMDWQQLKDNLTIDIILAYLAVLTNEDQLVQARNQLALSKQQVERLTILNNEGAIKPSDLSDLRGQYAGDELAIISASNALESSKISLFRLMNMPYNSNLQLERLDAESYATVYNETPGQIYETSLREFASVKAGSLRVEATEHSVKVARGMLFPTLSLNAGANTNYSSAARNSTFLGISDETSEDYVLVNGTPSPVIRKVGNFSSDKIAYGKQLNNNVYSQISLNLQIPIFNSLLQRNRIRRAKLDLKANRLVFKNTKTELQQAIIQAYVNMTTSRDRYKTLLEQVNAYTESFKAAEVRFNAGVGTPIDYLTAKNNLDAANLSLIAAKYDYVLRTKVLDYYQGKQLW